MSAPCSFASSPLLFAILAAGIFLTGCEEEKKPEPRPEPKLIESAKTVELPPDEERGFEDLHESDEKPTDELDEKAYGFLFDVALSHANRECWRSDDIQRLDVTAQVQPTGKVKDVKFSGDAAKDKAKRACFMTHFKTLKGRPFKGEKPVEFKRTKFLRRPLSSD